jgi:hypothetical protein
MFPCSEFKEQLNGIMIRENRKGRHRFWLLSLIVANRVKVPDKRQLP